MSFIEFSDFFTDIGYLIQSKGIEHGKTQQSLALLRSINILTVESAEADACRCGMQRYIMEYCHNAVFFQERNESAPLIDIGSFYIKHMSIVHTALGNHRKLDSAGILQRL